MRGQQLDIVFIGLTITSSWGNGHATTYRSLIKALSQRGHRILFLERDMPWYASNRDLPVPPHGRTELYSGIEELKERFAEEVRLADIVVVGSFVPDGVEVGRWVTETVKKVSAFYDIDTPLTMAKLQNADFEYLAPDLIPQYDLYFSFTGGPILARLERDYGSPMARALYCAVDPDAYYPCCGHCSYDLGYMGTYSSDRQPVLSRLMLQPAIRWRKGRFIVAGPQYPTGVRWPKNVERVEHLPPDRHCSFYNAQRFTLNVTRADMVKAGYSPSVRLFEAAACATPIISDYWEGLESFFIPGVEILLSQKPEDTLNFLKKLPDEERRLVGERARMRVLTQHTAMHRAEEFEQCAREALQWKATKRGKRHAVSGKADRRP
ncbi:MAG: glycosyltransferase [Candidatus Abyssobacteria bacterium SURF_5]|uniref:Glycosyltransferase n=1 Tax=Abyssobacteria bacterium (strain SURF_5) TaxID=2093360 RepID=A0A3A4NCA1_ABYX5|nr:MAG: glycosyltransferase [Candidatus Abyssubacteria bacterium SURF_5]